VRLRKLHESGVAYRRLQRMCRHCVPSREARSRSDRNRSSAAHTARRPASRIGVLTAQLRKSGYGGGMARADQPASGRGFGLPHVRTGVGAGRPLRRDGRTGEAAGAYPVASRARAAESLLDGSLKEPQL